MGTIKIYAFVLIMLFLFTARGFPSQSGFVDNSDAFARCEVCHIENAENARTSPHNLMRCIECHTISDFNEESHNATTLKCSTCHEGNISGLNHKKYSYFPEPYFVYNFNMTADNNGNYITILEPHNIE